MIFEVLSVLNINIKPCRMWYHVVCCINAKLPEEESYSQTLVPLCQTTKRHIPEDTKLDTYFKKKLWEEPTSYFPLIRQDASNNSSLPRERFCRAVA
jgi:hypothetical protein